MSEEQAEAFTDILLAAKQGHACLHLKVYETVASLRKLLHRSWIHSNAKGLSGVPNFWESAGFVHSCAGHQHE